MGVLATVCRVISTQVFGHYAPKVCLPSASCLMNLCPDRPVFVTFYSFRCRDTLLMVMQHWGGDRELWQIPVSVKRRPLTCIILEHKPNEH